MALAQPVNKLTKYDIIAILLILVISFSFIAYFFISDKANATGFEIYVDGKLHSSYKFSQLKNGQIIELTTNYGYNKFMYENNSVTCIETDCKDKLEIKSGKIKKVNQILVCMPHKLIVQITGKNNIDKISY